MTIKYRCGKCLMGFREETLPTREAHAKSGRCPDCGLLFRAAAGRSNAETDRVYGQPAEAERVNLREVEKCP